MTRANVFIEKNNYFIEGSGNDEGRNKCNVTTLGCNIAFITTLPNDMSI